MKIKQILIIFIVSFSLTACMGFKFTYNNIDWFLPWYVDDYLSLNKEQDKAFDRQLTTLWNWHRKQQLPEYNQLLTEIIDDLDNDQISIEQLHYYSSKIGDFYSKIIDKSLEQSIPIIATLSDRQVSELLDAIADEDEEFNEYVADTDLKERIKERRKSIRKVIRKWIGRLSKEQKQLINIWSKEAETTLEFHQKYVAETRVVFKQALATRSDQPSTKIALSKLMTQPELLRSDDYNKTIERNSQRFRLLIINTLATLSKKQRRKLRNKINNYAEDFSELAEQ